MKRIIPLLMILLSLFSCSKNEPNAEVIEVNQYTKTHIQHIYVGGICKLIPISHTIYNGKALYNNKIYNFKTNHKINIGDSVYVADTMQISNHGE